MDSKFTEEYWSSISELVSDAHRLSARELEQLRQNPVARLIAAIPVLAGCDDADRVAVQHVSTYITAGKASEIFDHRKEDDQLIQHRLERISHFPNGDKRIIERGMNLLALCMISGYEGDITEDRRRGVYNPVGAQVWDAQAEKTRLIKAIDATHAPEMDGIFGVEEALRGEWNS